MKKLFAIIYAMAIAIFMTACSEKEIKSGESSAASSLVSDSASAATSEEKIYSDNLVVVYFVKKHTMPGVNGELYVDLTVNNKSDKEITVALSDGYINDSMVTFCSGVPLNILPDKKGSNSFFCKYDGSSDSVKKIGFKLLIIDKNAATLETTKSIEVKF